MTQSAADPAYLERRRRAAIRGLIVSAALAVVCWPLAVAVGNRGRDTLAGVMVYAGIAGFIAVPWIIRAWQGFMRRRMLTAVVAGRPDIRHIDAAQQAADAREALASEAFALDAFRRSGLVEAFASARVTHIVTGATTAVPFALAEITLLEDKGYVVFEGVLGSFRLARVRPGLTIVARDRGLLGNLLARGGSSIQRLPLEDPAFEGIFEVYGDDQVGGRVVLTTTMLERLKRLDEVAHATGFACAFAGGRLLIAFHGMHWRCPARRIVEPIGTWLDGYREWLGGLVDLPVGIVQTLDLAAAGAAQPPRTDARSPSVPVQGGTPEVFSGRLWRLLGEGGMAAIYVASGTLFGGMAGVGAWYGMAEGYPRQIFWYMWGLIGAGLIYGVYAIGLGVTAAGKLAWHWNAPLRTFKGPES